MKKIFQIIFVIFVLMIIVSHHLVKSDLNKFFLNFLNAPHENRAVYVNEKQVEYVNEISDGLKHTQAFRFARNGEFGKCINIKIMRKESGLSLCVTKAPRLRYYKVFFQKFYLKDSDWQPIYRSVGTVSQKYLTPYLKEALAQSSSDEYNDYNGDLTDKEILLKLQECQRKKDSEWKLEEGDYNLSKEVCEIILRYLQ